jgi:hypothetical protein
MSGRLCLNGRIVQAQLSLIRIAVDRTMQRQHFLIAALGLLILIFIPSAAIAQLTTGPSSQPAVIEQVHVGLYINDIYELDLKKGTYTVDFYVWLRWRGDIDPTNIEFLNGSLDVKEHPDNREAGGEKYVSYHCRGTFHSVFSYRRYPLDEHELVLQMEDADHEASAVQYVVDSENLNRVPAVQLSGWRSDPPRFTVRQNVYETNFGDPTRPSDATAVYSRLYCTVRVSHQSFSVYVKTFLGLFISVAIAFLSFVIRPSEMDPRFGVGLAAIFGAVSSEIITTGNLPDMPYLTLADSIHLISLFVIFLTLLQSCFGLRLTRRGKQALAARIDKIALFAFPISYAAIVGLMTIIH